MSLGNRREGVHGQEGSNETRRNTRAISVGYTKKCSAHEHAGATQTVDEVVQEQTRTSCTLEKKLESGCGGVRNNFVDVGPCEIFD